MKPYKAKSLKSAQRIVRSLRRQRAERNKLLAIFDHERNMLAKLAADTPDWGRWWSGKESMKEPEASERKAEGRLGAARCCAAPCISYPLEITEKTTCVYLRDGTKITVERDATTKGRAWLKVSQQARITTAQHNAADEPPAA